MEELRVLGRSTSTPSGGTSRPMCAARSCARTCYTPKPPTPRCKVADCRRLFDGLAQHDKMRLSLGPERIGDALMSERNYWTRQGSRGLRRRTLLGVSARTGVGAVGLALVGCGDDDDDAAADAFAGRVTPRRVVTGIDTGGKSYVVHDGETPGHLSDGFFVQDNIWIDDPSNPDPAATQDPADDPRSLLSSGVEIPVDGSSFGLMTSKLGGGSGPAHDEDDRLRDRALRRDRPRTRRG